MRNLVLLIATLIVSVYGFSTFSSFPSPAGEVVTSSPSESSQQPEYYEDYTQFFCRDKDNIESVVDAFSTGGDETARAVADTLVTQRQCDYLVTVRWEIDETVCLQLENGHCLAIQPAFTYNEDETERISGYMLVEPKGNNATRTTVMGAYRTVILNMN